MHCTLGNVHALLQLPRLLEDKEVVMFGFPNDGRYSIGNSMLMSNKNSGIIRSLREQIIKNVKEHFNKERAAGEYVPYNIFVISGPWAYAVETMRDPRDFQPKEDLKDRLSMINHSFDRRTTSVLPFYFYSYRRPGSHWSERQQHELLFDHA